MRIVVLATVSSLLLLHLPVRAQVSIKDTVVISAGRSLEPVEVLLSPSSEVVYVASDSGILAGQIELARKYVPIGSASLSIMLNDTTVLLEATDYVDRYLSWQSVQFRCNDPGTPIYYMEYHALSASGHALRFFLPEVHVGDTLRFLYRGSIPATEVVGNTVRMKLGDSCYFYYEGELQEKEVCEVQLSMLNSAFAGYIVQSEQDTIAVGDVSRLTVAAVDSAGVEVPMDSTTLLSYTITPDSLGKFIKATGDTVSSPLPDVLYADARAGRIQFLAHGTMPDSLQPVVIEAVQTNDTTKRGADTIYVRPAKDSLRIQIPSPKRIWPTLPSGKSGGNPGNRNRLDSILVRVLRGAQPVAMESVLVKTKFIQNTGGHDHDDEPPDSLMGTLRDLASTLSKKGEIRLRTNDSGNVWIRYTAPLFSGQIQFIARSIADTTIMAVDTLIVKVLGLDSLANSQYYVKVGAPQNYWGTNDS
ncbi:MAG TPA: hypothetical protein VGB89_12010, partial [Bacteroidota bacterium]